MHPAADPQRPVRGGEGEGRHRDRPLPAGILGRGGVVVKGRDAEAPERAREARMAETARGSCTVAVTRSRPPQRG